MHLAKMELVAFLKAFAKTVKSVALTDKATYSKTYFVGGIYNLPVKIELA